MKTKSNDPIIQALVNNTNELFAAVASICKDYNDKIKKP